MDALTYVLEADTLADTLVNSSARAAMLGQAPTHGKVRHKRVEAAIARVYLSERINSKQVAGMAIAWELTTALAVQCAESLDTIVPLLLRVIR